MTETDNDGGVPHEAIRSDLELLRLARLSGEYDAGTLETIRETACAWVEGSGNQLRETDTAFLVEGLFKCGLLTEAAAVAKKRAALGEAPTAFDDFVQQYLRLANYDLALPALPSGPPLFPPTAPADAPRVLSLYHTSITFHASGYGVRTQALLANSKLRVRALTRIGYPWAAGLAKAAIPKGAKTEFESSSGNVKYAHRRGHVTKQSLIFSNIALGKHEILKAICDDRPNVVHAASNFVNALPALLAARECGLPFVYEMRGMWELTAGVGIPCWLESERYELERRIETFLARNSDRVIVLSEVQKRELTQRGVDPARIEVIINGHEHKELSLASSSATLSDQCPGLQEWLAGRVVIGYAGAIAVYEGLQDLVLTLAQRQQSWPNVALVIAGDGPYSYPLRALVSELGLEDRVKLLGRVPGEVAEALYSVVDLCVLPRRPDLVSQLITPLKTVEILSHGKLLLASNVDAIAEQLARYGYGETFVAGDLDDLAKQLDRLLSDLPRLKAHYLGASARIHEGFSWSAIAGEWDRLMIAVANSPLTETDVQPARNALAPLYDERPARQLEPLRLWRRLARANLVFAPGRTLYVRCPVNLDLRIIAVPDGSELGQDVAFGTAHTDGRMGVRELRPLTPGKYSVFLYVEWARSEAQTAELCFMQAPDARQPHDALELLPVKREVRQLLAFEIEHDAKTPTELELLSEHVGPTRVALSYIPLPGAELNTNFIQRTKSKVTGTRFHYVNVDAGSSGLELFPRLSGPLIVEMTPWAEGEILENRLRQVAKVHYVPRDGSLFPALDRSRTNVLIAANINETLLDGSTIWLKTLANTLANEPGVNVYVATNALLVSNGVTAELFDKPNIAKIDVFSAGPERTLDLAKHIQKLDRTAGGFDLVLLRGVDFAKVIVDKALRDRSVYYGAGMFARDPAGVTSTDEAALQVAAKCSAIVFQSPTMRALFLRRVPSYEGDIYCIPPCVEASALLRARVTTAEAGAERLVVYAGKLIREYGVAELAQAVARLRHGGTRVRLVILGNKFDRRDPAYQKQFEAAMVELGPAATWLPAVAPSAALSWVARAHAVWGWRHGDFENSHFEISTKMVEAIGCGTPIVLYPASANRQLMGEDYLGFAESAEDATAALHRLLSEGRAAFAALFDRLKGAFVSTAAYAPLLERVRQVTRERHETTVAARRRYSILIAAHDFRFIENVEGRLLGQGHEVTREYWKGHATRYEYGQTRAAARADIVFCEWCLGNAVWWSRNLPAGKRLIIRLHLQELQTTYPAAVDFARVEKVLFISPYVMRAAIAKFNIPPEKCLVIPISVRLQTAPAYSDAETRARRNTLGMVGLTPWRKRPDRALELLLTLRERYPQLTLSLKGHPPSQYEWMAHRKEELANYQAFFREIARLERLGVVRVSGYDDQLEAFYRGAGWILSLSDFEGCHTAVAEGGIMGCLPLMTNWGGADEVYAPSLVQADLAELVRYFDVHYESFEQDSRAIQAQFTAAFGLERVFEHWNELLFPRGASQVYSPASTQLTGPGRARAADGRSDS